MPLKASTDKLGTEERSKLDVQPRHLTIQQKRMKGVDSRRPVRETRNTEPRNPNRQTEPEPRSEKKLLENNSVRRLEKKYKIYFPHGRRAPGKTWAEMTGKERYVTSLRIRGGRGRAAFWRKLGFPNLVKARDAARKYREERMRAGLLPPKRVARLQRIVDHKVRPEDANEARAAEIFERGKSERQRSQMLGELLPAGNYDPQYLMRREFLILDAMRRSPVYPRTRGAG